MEAKTQFSDIDFKIEILSENDDLSDFSCGNIILDDFFHKEVVLCCKYKYLTAYSVKYIKSGEILCLFTLANDVITLDGDDVEEIKDSIGEEYKFIFEQQTSFPAVNIGHLATKKEYQSNGIGSFVITYVLGMLLEHQSTGVQFLTVDSLNSSDSNRFYMSNGFSYQTNEDMYSDTRRMFRSLIEYI